MRTDIDFLMKAREVDVILVAGAGQHNPTMHYLTGGANLTRADLIKKRGGPTVLFHNSMERDEASKSELVTCSYSKYPLEELLKETNGNHVQAMALRYKHMFSDLGITSGRVALYGLIELGYGYAIVTALQETLPEIIFIGYQQEDVLFKTMATKDTEEVERIRCMGEVSTGVVAQVADFLTGHDIRNGILIKQDGDPLTVGSVKRKINIWLVERGAENPKGTIFAIGRDAGVPHSIGNPDDVIRLGETIVFDIFPCETGGGYFHDFTRTWCLGYAPEEVKSIFDQVLSVYRQITSELKVDTSLYSYQQRACDLFEAMGHSTVLTHPGTEVGYVHGIGHGVGLNVHEQPSCSSSVTSADILVPGTVFTIEPGLYYPQCNLGVRLENTIWVTPDGGFEILAEYPLNLVLPMKSRNSS